MDEIDDRMCHRPTEEARMCYLPGQEPRRFNPSTFQFEQGDASAESFLPPISEVEAELARYEQEFEQILADSGVTKQEFAALVQYIREQEAVKYKVTERDLENFILAHRPQQPRFPGTTDPRGYSLFGLRPLAFFTHPYVAAVASIALDFVPVLGAIKVVYESVSGNDVITGAKLPTWVRVLGPLGKGVGQAKNAVKVIRGIGKVAAGASKVAVNKIAPLAIFVALANKPAPQALRIIDKLADMDVATIKAARAEAEAVKGAALPITKTQSAALKQVSGLLSPSDIVSVQKAAKPAAISPVKPPKVPDALPPRTQPATRTRKPKTSRPKYKTKGDVVLTKLGGLKEAAGQIHSLVKLDGQTVAVVEVVVNGKRMFVAATNSGKHFLDVQKTALKKMGIVELPAFGSEVVHAEVNVMNWVTQMRKAGKSVKIRRWGISSGYRGHRICDACRSVIASLGGVIEEYSALSKTY